MFLKGATLVTLSESSHYDGIELNEELYSSLPNQHGIQAATVMPLPASKTGIMIKVVDVHRIPERSLHEGVTKGRKDWVVTNVTRTCRQVLLMIRRFNEKPGKEKTLVS